MKLLVNLNKYSLDNFCYTASVAKNPSGKKVLVPYLVTFIAKTEAEAACLRKISRA